MKITKSKIVDVILAESKQIKEDFEKRAKIYAVSGINLNNYEKKLVSTYIDLVVDLAAEVKVDYGKTVFENLEQSHAAWRLHSDIQTWLHGYIGSIDLKVKDGNTEVTADKLVDKVAKRLNETKNFMESRPLNSELFGMDDSNYESGVYASIVDTIVGVINIGGNEKTKELTLDLVEWWIFESVDKVITESDGTKINVEDPKELIKWIFKEKEILLQDNE